MTMNKHLMLLAMALCAVSLTACVEDNGKASTKTTQSQKAIAMANSVSYEDNAELDNIVRREKLTADPGLLGFIILLNQAGQPVMYTTVKGKVTSSGKRLTPTDRVAEAYQTIQVRAAPNDDGTYGSSDGYIYFWTNEGRYMQWNDKYLYSDGPLRLSVQPLVVDVSVQHAIDSLDKAPAATPAPTGTSK